MIEKRIEVRTIRVTAQCDCGEELVATGEQMMSRPPVFPHRCKNGHQESFRKTYPYIEYEPLN